MGPFLGKDLALPAMGGEPDSITISGFSGGSYTASQLHVIYSDLIKGSGLICGGPYGDDNKFSLTRGFYSDSDNTASIGTEKANHYLTEGKLDDLKNLENDPVYIFSGA